MTRLGIFGGAFDPPHIGHLILAEHAKEAFKLDKIIFIPTNLPPHKPAPIASAKDRLALVKLAISDKPYFEVSDIEIKRGGVSYTIDTIREFNKIEPHCEIFLLIGMDEAVNFISWKEPETIVKLAKLVVFTRPSYKRQGLPYLVELHANFIELNIDISSTTIRQFIKEGKQINKLAPEKVVAYIRKKKLYKNGKELQ